MSIALLFMLALQLGIPALLLTWYWHRRNHDRFELFIKTLVVAGFLWFDFYAGRWDLCGRHLRWQLLLLFIFSLSRHIREARMLPWWTRKGSYRSVLFTLKIFIVFLAGMIDYLLFKGSVLEGPALELSLPFNTGTYFTAQGGDFPLLNFHNSNPTQRYSTEITRVNSLGFRAAGLLPSDPDSYIIWHDTVVAPCNAKVIAVTANLPDMPLDSLDEDNPDGNNIVLEYSGCLIMLAHLATGTIKAKPGDTLKTGQVIGLVGKSGNSSEPLLGIHAVQGTAPDNILRGEGVPMRFNGKFLIRNEAIEAGQKP